MVHFTSSNHIVVPQLLAFHLKFNDVNDDGRHCPMPKFLFEPEERMGR
jgi:hypothetical protein